MLDKIAAEFLELSSEQRLKIINILWSNKSTLSKIATTLDSSTSEVHRNLNRLAKSNIVTKDNNGNYCLTTYGTVIHAMIPSVRFFLDNKKYFINHSFETLPINYIQSAGSLTNSKRITGYVRVMECWKEIYENSDEYLYNILHDVSYDAETIQILKNKLKSGINLKTIFDNDAIVSGNRKEVLENTGLDKLVKNDHVKRRFGKNIPITLALNEKQACVGFSTHDGRIDISEVFFSEDPEFHAWCLDFFLHAWDLSLPFFDEKLEKSDEHKNQI